MFQGELLTTLTIFLGYLYMTIAHNIDWYFDHLVNKNGSNPKSDPDCTGTRSVIRVSDDNLIIELVITINTFYTHICMCIRMY